MEVALLRQRQMETNEYNRIRGDAREGQPILQRTEDTYKTSTGEQMDVDTGVKCGEQFPMLNQFGPHQGRLSRCADSVTHQGGAYHFCEGCHEASTAILRKYDGDVLEKNVYEACAECEERVVAASEPLRGCQCPEFNGTPLCHVCRKTGNMFRRKAGRDCLNQNPRSALGVPKHLCQCGKPAKVASKVWFCPSCRQYEYRPSSSS